MNKRSLLLEMVNKLNKRKQALFANTCLFILTVFSERRTLLKVNRRFKPFGLNLTRGWLPSWVGLGSGLTQSRKREG